MSTGVQPESLARGVLESLTGGRVVLAVGGTSYRLHLDSAVPAGEITTPVGRRIKGTIHANALRMHSARGGGRFVEPIWGAPRIVAGRVVAVDEPARRVLIDAGVPMWVTPPEGQDMSVIREGVLVNFYVESGAVFRPIIDEPE